MFKVGDKVRRIGRNHLSGDGIKVGEIGEIDSLDYWGAHIKGERETLRHCRDYIELVKDEGPVREVTRREIVEGRYGMVEVGQQNKALVPIRIANRNGELRNCTIEELREAAHILNQIAEALEDA